MKFIFQILVVLAISVFLPLMANAEVDTLGIMNKAMNGDCEAQYQLGRMYYDGKIVKKDYARAEEWLHQAAEQGHAGAQLWLGYMYDAETGVFRSKKETEIVYGATPQYPIDAEKWYRKAAEQDLPEGQMALAWYYMRGRGSRGGSDEQFFWLNEAAENGNAEAQWHLGHKHWLDASLSGSEKDFVQAYMWFDLSASSDSVGSRGASRDRDKVAKSMTEEQIVEAKRLVRKWKAKRQPDKEK